MVTLSYCSCGVVVRVPREAIYDLVPPLKPTKFYRLGVVINVCILSSGLRRYIVRI